MNPKNTTALAGAAGQLVANFTEPQPTWRKPNFVAPTRTITLSAVECADVAFAEPDKKWETFCTIALARGVPPECLVEDAPFTASEGPEQTLTVVFG